MNKKQLFIRITSIILFIVILSSCGSKKVTGNDVSNATGTELSAENENRDGIPTVIDFYATWCVPCKQISPIFDELALEYKDQLNFLRVDVDQQPEIAQEYDVKSMPTFVFLDADGKEIDRIVGSFPEDLKNKVKNLADNQ